MQIFQLLKSDHAEVKKMLQKITETGGMKTRQKLFGALEEALVAHTRAEQQVFYRTLEDYDETADMALEAEVEHEIVDRLLADLSNMDVDPERWSAKCKVLRELVEHHIKEEESEMFRLARKVLDRKQIQELGERFQSIKKQQLEPAA